MSQRRGRRRIIEYDDDDEMPEPSQTQGRRRRGNNDDDISYNSTQTQSSQRRTSGKSQTQNSLRFADDDLSQSQLSQSSSQKNISDDELNRLMGHAVRYILVADRSRHPILRTNIQKNILNNTKHFRTVMDHVKTTLHKIFGYRLVDIENGKYILVNAVSNEDQHITFPTEKNQMVLLFLCLAHIFMSEDCCTEDNLWNFLRKLKIVEGDCFRHEYFGNVENLVTVEFVKQRYLHRSKVENIDPEKFQYQWGPRADAELSRMEVLKFVSEMHRNKPPQDWASQYRIALERERQPRQN